jgi:DNA-binding FadR family transcriptional regulator
MDAKKNETLVDRVAKKLINYIIKHRMTEGDQLPTEVECMTMLDVSRGTLREAFKALVARNILEIRQGAGTFISSKRGIPDDPLGLSFIYDDNRLALEMLEVRLMLEPKIAELAAANASPEQKEVIRSQVELTEDLIKRNEPYAAADSSFHSSIAEASGNRVIESLSNVLNQSVTKNIEITLDVQRENNTVYYHRKILRAIEAGNVLNAHHFMAMHLMLMREFMLDKIEHGIK